MKDKNRQVNDVIYKLKIIADNSIKKKRYNSAFAAISAASEILYSYNQKYIDEDLENLVSIIGDELREKYHRGKYDKIECSKNIFIYDGFGLDTRGVILMYLNALGINKYHVCYITNIAAKESIPTIKSMCRKYGFEMHFIDMSDYKKSFLQLSELFDIKKPKSAFFYTTPYDSSASAAFHIYEGLCDRYLIDLTDHAFWLGKCANDFFLGSREMSAYIEHYKRHIPKDKCIKLGVNLLIEDITENKDLPFDIENTKYIFSGGSLYKTLGDSNYTYYRIVTHILEKHHDVKFIYAGDGDDGELNKVIKKFPNRVFHLNERKDFFYIMKNCIFYLNTYPMFGGMMMKYSALANKLPITLKHGSDSDGLLLNQEKCRISYDTYEELVTDVDRLLIDKDYLIEREKLLEGSIISEKRFARNIYNLIENNKTDYSHEFKELDTDKLRNEFLERFDLNKSMQNIAKKKNISLFRYFPDIFFLKAYKIVFSE